MLRGEWRPVGFYSLRLVADYERMSSDEQFVKLGKIATLGPAGRRIQDAFTKSDISDATGRRAIWQNNPTESKQSMKVETDVYVHAKRGREDYGDKLWQQRSRLLLCIQPRLNTARVTAAWVSEPTVGAAWVPCRPLDDIDVRKWEKAFAVWFNSTLGIVSIIGTASPKVFARPIVSLDAMRRLPVPRFSPDQIEHLASVFDFHADAELLTLADLNRDSVRLALDDAVCNVLGMSKDELAITRQELMREPSVLG